MTREKGCKGDDVRMQNHNILQGTKDDLDQMQVPLECHWIKVTIEALKNHEKVSTCAGGEVKLHEPK